MTFVIGVVGWKNSGKTTLVEKLVSALVARGTSVSTVKHTHHAVDLDQPGKDTYRHREAGAGQTLLASSARWALMTEHAEKTEPSPEELLARFDPVDMIIVEGFKNWPIPKIEIHREESGGSLIAEENPEVKAVVSDKAHLGLSVPRFGLNDIEGLADFIVQISADN